MNDNLDELETRRAKVEEKYEAARNRVRGLASDLHFLTEQIERLRFAREHLDDNGHVKAL